MSRHMLFAFSITALGALLTLVNLRDGLAFSFPLVLGLLILADGVLRLYMLAGDTGEPAERQADTATAPAATERAPLRAVTAEDGENTGTSQAP